MEEPQLFQVHNPPARGNSNPFLELPHCNVAIFSGVGGTFECCLRQEPRRFELGFEPTYSLLKQISSAAYTEFRQLSGLLSEHNETRFKVAVILLMTILVQTTYQSEEQTLAFQYCLLKLKEAAFLDLDEESTTELKCELQRAATVPNKLILSTMTSMREDITRLAATNRNDAQPQDAKEPTWKHVLIYYFFPYGLFETVKQKKKLLWLVFTILICTLLFRLFGFASDVLEFVGFFAKSTKCPACKCQCQ